MCYRSGKEIGAYKMLLFLSCFIAVIYSSIALLVVPVSLHLITVQVSLGFGARRERVALLRNGTKGLSKGGLVSHRHLCQLLHYVNAHPGMFLPLPVLCHVLVSSLLLFLYFHFLDSIN